MRVTIEKRRFWFEAEDPIKKFLNELSELSAKGYRTTEVRVNKETHEALRNAGNGLAGITHIGRGEPFRLFGMNIILDETGPTEDAQGC